MTTNAPDSRNPAQPTQPDPAAAGQAETYLLQLLPTEEAAAKRVFNALLRALVLDPSRSRL